MLTGLFYKRYKFSFYQPLPSFHLRLLDWPLTGYFNFNLYISFLILHHAMVRHSWKRMIFEGINTEVKAIKAGEMIVPADHASVPMPLLSADSTQAK